MALSGGGALPSAPTKPSFYPDGPGLAILFADEDDTAFSAERCELARVLPFFGFVVHVFDGRDIMNKTREALTRAYDPATMTRVLFCYTGHGGRSEHADGSEGFLCGQGAPVDVKALQFVVNSCVPKDTPKLFVLDCCYSTDKSAPPALFVNPGGESLHDVSCLRASSPGFFGYYSKSGPSAGLTAFLARTLDDISPEAFVHWNDLKGLVEPRMKEFVKEVEPRQDCLGKIFLLTKVSWTQARELLRAEKMALAKAAVEQIEFTTTSLEGLLRGLEPTQENLEFVQEQSSEVRASLAALKANPFNGMHISNLDFAIDCMLGFFISTLPQVTDTAGENVGYRSRGIADAAIAVLRAHAAF